jgi:hypothetical protein
VDPEEEPFMSKHLKVFLVEYDGAFSSGAGGDAQRVNAGIQRRLQQWFQAVVTHVGARPHQPTGYERRVHVAWVNSVTSSDVSPYDIVIHFDASSISGTTSPLLTPYNSGLGELRDGGSSISNLSREASGGRTRLIRVGNMISPILSVVYVLYNAGMSNADIRIDDNVTRFCVSAFHEAGHNKDRSNSLHSDGGGGIFADIHSGGVSATRPSNANNTFFAERIWNWGAQYVTGASLAPQRAPASV